MVKIKVILQNNKEFETEVESYDALQLFKTITEFGDVLVPIGDIVVNKHHIECIHEI